MEMLIVFGVITLMTVVLAGGTLLFTRLLARRMAALDARLRPEEARTGRCGACDGAGTKLEVWPSEFEAQAQVVTCFRCGGTGEPLPPGETARLPGSSPTGFQLRQARDYLQLRRSLRRIR